MEHRLFSDAVIKALNQKNHFFSYNAGDGITGVVWFEPVFNKIMYRQIETCIVGSMSIRQAKRFLKEFCL